jgi:hypothetical protein
LGELVKLSVGGVKFMTTVGTLTAQGRATNFFTGLLSGRMGSTKDGDAYFIDREGEHFGLLLRWMRCGRPRNFKHTVLRNTFSRAWVLLRRDSSDAGAARCVSQGGRLLQRGHCEICFQ